MKKHSLVLFLLLLCSYFCRGQEHIREGMYFERLPAWKDVLVKAKSKNKLILAYCYTTWCAPCKKMSTDIFPLKEVGIFYNVHFINVKIQMDSSVNDDQYIRNWYREAHEIAKKYPVDSYPTYLIFSSDGEIIHRFSSQLDAELFIEKGRQALESKNWYYKQLKDYEKGNKNPDKILQLGRLSQEVGYYKKANDLFSEYLALQPTIFTKENLSLLYEMATSRDDRGFKIALDSAEMADRILGKVDASNDLVEDILVQETMRKIVGSTGEPDFAAIRDDLRSGYPGFADYVSSYIMMRYYRDVEEWDKFVEYADKAIQHKKYKIPNYAIRSNAEIVFKNVNDKKLLEKALAWMGFLMNKDEIFLKDRHTYANLLYKLGRIKEAINEEKSIIKDAKQVKGNTTLYESALTTMEKGEPTW